MDRMPSNEIDELLAQSSIGGHAWCFNCRHPDRTHLRGRCVVSDAAGDCICKELRRMTPEEWLAWKGSDV